LHHNPELCRKISVECNISENVSLPQVLMFHGTKDRTINPKVSVVVYEALKKYHKEVQLYMLEGADHGGSEFFSDKVLDIMEAFLQRIVSAS
jgi:dipeptidyl aminopeptidase/acylaminoacyl peptidase